VGVQRPRNRYGGRSAAERRAERRQKFLAAGLELFRRALEAYVVITATDPRWARVAYLMVGVSPEIEQRRRERRNAWAGLLCALAEAGVEQGRIPPRDFELTMKAFAGAVNTLVYEWCQSDPQPPLDEVTKTLTHLLFSAVSAMPVP
jgi:AcrR family transcriptional regulator